MLSSLISYEVERRTVGNSGSIDPQEKEARKYFHAKSEKRHPIPQLVFSQKKTEFGETANNMSNFALLYPSQTLADAFDPVETLINGRSLADVRQQLTAHFDRIIEDAELSRFGTGSGEADRWYWAAPLLLDRRTQSIHKVLEDWLTAPSLKHDSAFFDDVMRQRPIICDLLFAITRSPESNLRGRRRCVRCRSTEDQSTAPTILARSIRSAI
jgi:hypothetical protein